MMNVARHVLCQLLVLVAFVGAAGMSKAGDVAEYTILGFSQDNRYFAFEQYGIQDGSGFAYSDVFILDLEDDRWTKGSPFRLRADDETTTLPDLRMRSLAMARPVLDDLQIDPTFRLLAATSAVQHNRQEDVFSFSPRAFLGSIDQLHTLTINPIALPNPAICEGMGQAVGYELLLTVDGEGTSLLHRDSRIPSSRNCPLAYGLAAVVAPFGYQERRGVALVSVYQLGFEGPDRRFLAVPFDLSF